MIDKFSFEIIRYFDTELLVAEIYYNNEQWASLSHDGDKVKIKFYPPLHKKHWEFGCEEALKILEKAKTRLLMGRNKGSFVFSEASVEPQEVNQLAKNVLERILNHPKKKMIQAKLERFGDVVDIYAPEMGGARYTTNGEFIGFLEI